MRSVLALCLLALASPALAGATAWQEVAPETRMRLISSDRIEGGRLLAGIELDMPEGYKTYWRVPGETGIPTMLEDLGSSGASAPRVLWPHPVIDQTADYVDFVYFGPTVLPVALEAAGPTAELRLRVTMGICSDICVPVQASFALPVDAGRTDPGQSLRLQQALGNVPLAPPDDTVIGAVTLGEHGLVVPLNSAEIDPMSVIAAGDDPGLLFGAPQKSPDSPAIVLPLLGGDEQQVLGHSVDISFMTPAGPFVVERTVAPSGSTAR